MSAGVAVGVALGLLVGLARRGPSAPRDPAVETLAQEVARLRQERESADAAAREHLAGLEARVVAAERNAAVETPAGSRSAPVAESKPSDAVELPAPRSADAPDWLESLLASDGARLLPLHPGESAPGASGYAIWSRARGVVVVSASDLPEGRSDAVYRVRVRLSGGATVWAGDVPASERGTLVLTAPMPEGTGWRVTGVDLYRDPPNVPALTASLRP